VGGERDRAGADCVKAGVQLEGEQQIRQLGPRVGGRRIVSALELKVVELHHAISVADAADGHDPRSGSRQQPVKRARPWTRRG
jgi:hypothetical protein